MGEVLMAHSKEFRGDGKKIARPTSHDIRRVPLEVDEMRIISDLWVMHAKVSELRFAVNNINAWHGDELTAYADPRVVEIDLEAVDAVYQYYVSLQEKLRDAARKKAS